jgi:hypothetical protein
MPGQAQLLWILKLIQVLDRGSVSDMFYRNLGSINAPAFLQSVIIVNEGQERGTEDTYVAA